MDSLTLAGVGVGFYNAVVAAASNFRHNNNQKKTVSVAERAYEPITSLFVAAMIPLLKDHEQINIKFYYGATEVKLCPDTNLNRLKRTASQVSAEQYSRLQSKAWIGIVVKAICLYDLDKNDDRAKEIKFLFEKAREGLIEHFQTYRESDDPVSEKANKYILEAISFLQYKTGKIEDLEDPAKVAASLQKRISELMEKTKNEKGAFIDSRPFWCSYPSESADKDLLVLKVKEFKLMHEGKKKQQTSINPLTNGNFKGQLKSFKQYIRGRQESWPEFLKHAKDFEFPEEGRAPSVKYDEAEFD